MYTSQEIRPSSKPTDLKELFFGKSIPNREDGRIRPQGNVSQHKEGFQQTKGQASGYLR
jgi:hypothetical protein